MAHESGTDMENIVAGGPGLAFVAYPQALSLLPGASIWAIIFCAMIFCVGMGSCTTDTEICLSFVIDLVPALRKGKRELVFRGVAIFILFLLGLPLVCGGGYFLWSIVDNYVTGINSYIFGLC